MILRAKCLKCQSMIKHDPQRVTGCLCDSDAPTWIGLGRDGRLIHYSQVDLTIIEEAK